MKEIMNAAWSFIKKGFFTNLSDALKASWKRIKVIRELKQGAFKFSYAKACGEVREAVGTLHPSALYGISTMKDQSSFNLVSYFDLEKEDWRQFDITRFIA